MKKKIVEKIVSISWPQKCATLILFHHLVFMYKSVVHAVIPGTAISRRTDSLEEILYLNVCSGRERGQILKYRYLNF